MGARREPHAASPFLGKMNTNDNLRARVAGDEVSRRSILQAAGWAAPIVVATAVVPLAAASTAVTTNWVAAVRTTNTVTTPASSLNPGFRFGSATVARSFSATVSITTSTAGLTFATTFVTYGSETWSWSVVSNSNGTYTYTASTTVTAGPVNYNAAAAVPGHTTGVTIRGVRGSYTSSVVGLNSTDLHRSAAFSY